MLQKIESNNTFDLVFLDFWEPGDIPDQYGSHKILKLLYCMTLFGLVSAIGMKEITSDQVARWYFGNFFVPFGLPKTIVVDADGILWSFQEDFPKDPTNTSTCSYKVQIKVN